MSEIESTAPVAPAVSTPAAPAAPAPEPTADPVADPVEGESKPEAPPEKTLTQSEVNEIVQKEKAKARRQAERMAEARLRAEYAERQLAELKAPPKQEATSGEPVPAQFQDYESYIAALTDWKVEQKLSGLRKETEAQQVQRQMAERADQVLPKLKPAMEKYDDFQEVATSFKAPPALQAAMLESDHTGELYYYLGSNPAELDRLSRLSDVKQVLAVKELESRLTAPPQPTRTPAPIVPNNGKSAVSKSFTEMNYDEFAEYRRKRLARKR